MRVVLFAIVLSACGNNNDKAVDARMADGATELVVTLTGGANALYWDASASKLYLTDDTNNNFVSWTQAGGLSTVGALPVDPSGSSPGGIVKLADGSFLVADFGFGAHGTLDQISSGTATALTGLAVANRRIGLALDSTGTIWESYFTGGGGSPQTGGVATVTLGAASTATETEVAGGTTNAGFKKLVGMAVSDTYAYASDQSGNAIWAIKKADNSVTMLTAFTAPDLLYMLPNGDLLTGGSSTISRITQAGVVSALTLDATFGTAHGIAYDPVGKHLFVIDHSSTAGTMDALHVIPFTP